MYIFSPDPEDIIFPPPEFADPEGIVAIGGDFSVSRLLEAYRNGIFPWGDYFDHILWWSPDPRFVLPPAEVRITKSMKQVLRSDRFRVSTNQAFEQVIRHCQTVKRHYQDGNGTWLSEELLTSFVALHQMGHAHSVEVWKEGTLVGGLYGMVVGRVFCGESMFSLESNASKVAFIYLARNLERQGFSLIDCQVENAHLSSLGGRDMPRKDFLAALKSIPFALSPDQQRWNQQFCTRFEQW